LSLGFFASPENPEGKAFGILQNANFIAARDELRRKKRLAYDGFHPA